MCTVRPAMQGERPAGGAPADPARIPGASGQSEGRIEQSVECELDGRYRPIHMRKNYVTADFDRPLWPG